MDGAEERQDKARLHRAPRPFLTFAGIWDSVVIAGDRLESFTIVTQPARSPLNAYHDRAPVVIEPSAWATWLDLSADVTPLLRPESPDRFEVALAT